jgi:hypothetical protein
MDSLSKMLIKHVRDVIKAVLHAQIHLILAALLVLIPLIYFLLIKHVYNFVEMDLPKIQLNTFARLPQNLLHLNLFSENSTKDHGRTMVPLWKLPLLLVNL